MYESPNPLLADDPRWPEMSCSKDECFAVEGYYVCTCAHVWNRKFHKLPCVSPEATTRSPSAMEIEASSWIFNGFSFVEDIFVVRWSINLSTFLRRVIDNLDWILARAVGGKSKSVKKRSLSNDHNRVSSQAIHLRPRSTTFSSQKFIPTNVSIRISALGPSRHGSKLKFIFN